MDNLTGEILRATGGWSQLDPGQWDGMDDEQRSQFLETADLFRSCFEDTDAGQRVLELLIRDHLVIPRIVVPGDDLAACGIRQGQADIVRKILRYIAIAKSGGEVRM